MLSTGIVSYIFSYTMYNTITRCSSTWFPQEYFRKYSPIQCSIPSSAVLVHAFHGQCRTYSPIQCTILLQDVLIHAFHGHSVVHILLCEWLCEMRSARSPILGNPDRLQDYPTRTGKNHQPFQYMISTGILSYIFSYTGILSYIFSYTMFNIIISCSSTCFPRA